MPVHDWTRVSAGTFHDFHTAWIIHLKEALNGGLLPNGFYALSEQHAGPAIADVLTLHAPSTTRDTFGEASGVAVLPRPPRVGRKVELALRAIRKTLVIRHASGHRVVAMIEIVSPANKDRPKSVQDFGAKAYFALQSGCHLLIVDLFPPGPYDPRGIADEIVDWLGRDDEDLDPNKPLTLSSFVADPGRPEMYVERIAVGDPLPEMPLFLDPDWHIATPLETTYEQAYRGVPEVWREVIEGRRSASQA
jgi:hypothetical protein